jgi:heparan-sulfate lyase
MVRVKDERSNQWDVTIPFSNSEKAKYSFASANEQFIERGGAHNSGAINKLLSRLDLNAPGMEKVKRWLEDPPKAAAELLSYYRARDFVKHPVDRTKRASMAAKYATERDIHVADEALKHIFIGQSAYPPYYCGDDINWGLRPVSDNEWVWQLNRMGFWDALGKAYWHTGDEQYAREWCLQLLDWTQKNPRDEEHDYAWRSIEAGIRGYRWTNDFYRFLDAPTFTPQVLAAFLNSCYDHASYLMTKYRKGSNWGLMEAEGMAFIAMTFPEFNDAEQWRREAIMRLNAEIENQVYADGHQRELAMGYHTSSIGWFKRTLDLARMNGLLEAFPESYLHKIEKMCEVPFKLGFPDGTTTQFGDSWTGAPGHTWPALKEWSAVFNRQDFLYVATEGKEGQKPSQTAFALENSGLYSIRSGWEKDDIIFVLKCGPDGGGHCQPDNGTFELYAGGRHLMPDAGSYIYSGDPENREWFRQTKVHQTLTLNGKNSAYAPRQLLWQPGDRLDILVVENSSYPQLTHRRAVFFVDKKYFIIVDEAIGPGSGDVDVHFQLGPGDAVFDSTHHLVRSNFADGWNVLVQSIDQGGLELQEEEGWVSFVYTKKERRPAFRYRMKKKANERLRFITVVAPYEGSTPPKIEAQVIGKQKVGSSKFQLKVTAHGVSRRIGYSFRGVAPQ